MIRSAVGMRNLRVAAIFVLALLIGAQLTLHNHSLIPEAGGAPPLVCAVCAFGADRITLDAPLLILLGFLVAAATAPVASPVRVTSRGRAPPARF
jgi:hypothetical protein